MPFLSGSLTFERFRVTQFDDQTFGEEHLDLMRQYVAGRAETASEENVHVGFLGGAHLFDSDFDLGKNLINEAVHFGVRIDTNQVPPAIKKAWLAMELAGVARDNPGGRPTKAQRQEAKEAVEARCEIEAATGKYRKQQSFSLLWDLRDSLVYFGGSAGNSCGHCLDLMTRAFSIDFAHLSSGSIAEAWAIEAERYGELDDCSPESFISEGSLGGLAWGNEHSGLPDFLGNEFLMWLWWMTETETDTIQIASGDEVTVMLARTLSLECPMGESGKETIASESPIKLPEAMQAIRSGKWPRKAGLTLARDGRQYDLTLAAETFGINGAKIRLQEDETLDDEQRIDAIRTLADTVDGLFETYCALRTDTKWRETIGQIRTWLTVPSKGRRQAA